MQVARDRQRRPDGSSDFVEVIDADKSLCAAALNKVDISTNERGTTSGLYIVVKLHLYSYV